MKSAPQLLMVLRRACTLAAISLAALAITTQFAFAQATYIYSGNYFSTYYSPYTRADRVQISLQLSAWLAPNQQCVDVATLPGFRLVMYDGINLMDSATPALAPGSGGFHAYVSTDQFGIIVPPWFVQKISAAQGVAITSAYLPAPNVCAGNTQVSNYDSTQGVPRNTPCPISGPCIIFPPTPSQSITGIWSFPPPQSLATMLITQFKLGIIPDIGTSIEDQLQQIETDINTNNGQACADLTSLINHVKAQKGNKLPTTQANFILTTLSNMQAELGCG
jgi:hypothetical protein